MSAPDRSSVIAPGSRPIAIALAVACLGAALSVQRTDAESATAIENPNGRIAFVSSWAENLAGEVYRVEVASGRRTNLSRNPAADNGAVISPNGRTILFRSLRDNAGAIWAMNADGTNQRPLAVGEEPTWSPDSAKIAFVRGDDVMTMAADGADVRRLAKGRSPTWSPDGRLLAWVDSSSVFVATPEGSEARRVFSTTAVYSPPSWAPDRTQVAVAAEVLLESGSVFTGVVTISIAGGEAQRQARIRLSDSPADVRPTWSPDGARIAYVHGGQIRAVRVRDRTSVAFTNPPKDHADTLPTWSPDGRFLAFVRGPVNAPQQLFVVPAAGGPARQLTHEDANSWLAPQDRVAWTPDGRSLIYSNQIDDNDSDVYTVNGDGSARRRLTTNAVHDSDPTFSPDGRWIAFVRTLQVDRAGNTNFELFLMRADGSDVRRLTHWAGEDLEPAWSPDGSKLVFVRRTPGEDPLFSLYTIWPDGSHLTRLRTPDRFYDSPSWSPDGRAVVLTTGAGDEEGVGIGGALIVVRADGGRPRTLVDPGEDRASYPEWSPDGRTITFVRETPCDYCDEDIHLWTVRPNGTGERRLVEDGRDAAWSPDGKHLVVLRNDLGIFARTGLPERELKAGRGAGAPGLSWQPVCARSGGPQGDVLHADASGGLVCGLGGGDRISGGPGRDRLFGQDGDDWIDGRGGGFDVVGCGPGIDRARADRGDLVGVDCEHVTRR